MSQPTYQRANQLTIHGANCLNQISPLASCHICQQLCPQQAISIQDGRIATQGCNLCGLCVMTCPTQVFQIDQPELLRQPKQQPLHLSCLQNTSAPDHALRLNCLQQLTPLNLLHLLYQYPQVTVYLCPEDCAACAQGWYPQGLLQQLEAYHIPAQRLTILTQSAQPDQPESTPPEPNQRREAFRKLWHSTERQSKKMVQQTVASVVDTFAAAPAQNTAAQQAEIFPQRLPLYALYVKQQLPFHADCTLPFRGLSCTACSFCSACTHLCPTQALTLRQTEAEQQLLFQPELCINCNLCQQVCMQHGLQWEDFMTQQQFLQTPQILAHSAEKICADCQHPFYQWPPTDSTTCPFCRPATKTRENE